MWLVTIIVLALAAFFTMKVLKSQDLRKAAEKEREMQSSGLEGSLGTHDASAANPASSTGNSDPSTTQSASDSSGSGNADSGASSNTNTSPVSAVAAAVSAGAAGSALSASPLLNSGDPMNDIREMIKILNLAEPDAGRLAISREEFTAIRHGGDGSEPSGEALTVVADRLRHMLA